MLLVSINELSYTPLYVHKSQWLLTEPLDLNSTPDSCCLACQMTQISCWSPAEVMAGPTLLLVLLGNYILLQRIMKEYIHHHTYRCLRGCFILLIYTNYYYWRHYRIVEVCSLSLYLTGEEVEPCNIEIMHVIYEYSEESVIHCLWW